MVEFMREPIKLYFKKALLNAGADLQSVPLTNIERHGLRFAKSAPAVIRHLLKILP